MFYSRAMSRYSARDFVLAIEAYHETNGYAPSVRDLQDSMGVSSTSVVNYWLKACRERGLIDFRNGIARSLTISPEGATILDG